MVLTGQKRNVLIGVLTVASSVALTSCASDTSAELKRIADENAKLKEEIKQLQAGLGPSRTTK